MAQEMLKKHLSNEMRSPSTLGEWQTKRKNLIRNNTSGCRSILFHHSSIEQYFF